MTDLLPCPFCGGEAKTFGPYGWYRQYGISHSCPTFYNGSSEMAQGFNSEKAAITAWNTRAADNIALQAEVERLRGALEQLIAGYEVWDFDPSTQKLVRLPDEKQTSWIRQARAALNEN